jgi:hypothetical protein
MRYISITKHATLRTHRVTRLVRPVKESKATDVMRFSYSSL